MRHTKSYAYLALAMMLVGANIGFGKAIIAVMPVLVFGLLRFVIAVAVMAPQFFKAAPRLQRHEWLTLFGQAFFGTFLFTLCMLYGVQHTTATAAGVITSTLPAAVAILSRLTLKERLQPRTLASILLAIAGIAVLNLSKSDSGDGGETPLIGNLFVMAAVLCEATYVVLSKRLTQTLSPMRITAYSHLFGLLLMLPFSLTAALSYNFSQVTPGMWLLVFWYALAASVIAFWLWLTGTKHVQANVAGIFTALMPLAAAFIGVVFLHESLSWAHFVALALVLTGIAVASWPQPMKTVQEV
ncbi:nucleotide-sugar transporter family protein [Collimonas fungivorans]|uniref:Nucleotide-sugar transporter family protein n=1 Tax=Collimonas fungivorans TaxID=158899 RepID=A0A127PGM8_9BURK|nr:DMT family transporter [Collimonas fungivorans]AMO96774.1 nucleotide-sugar transporter family protein [Collimonas fungivorans]